MFEIVLCIHKHVTFAGNLAKGSTKHGLDPQFSGKIEK